MEEKEFTYSEQPSAAAPRRLQIPTGNRELAFGFFILLAGILMFNSLLFCGYHLGYAIFAAAGLLLTFLYLVISGCRVRPYPVLLLGLSLVIIGAFARSDDSFVKFVLLCFLLVSVNLAFCLLAGQNRWATGGIASLLDVFRSVTVLSTGKMPAAFRGLAQTSRKGGSAMKKLGGALLGVAIALPLLCILIPLLMRADAAFEGILDQLPDFRFGEVLVTGLFGTVFGFWLYLRGVGLRHTPKEAPKEARPFKGVGAMTVNTVLIAVSCVYLVYLISQLAYFSGGFSGILPEGYTFAEYARRGFFEMAWLCAVNLVVMCLSVALCRKKADRSPLLTRLLCLFIGIVTLFLVVAASAKMYLYIGAYGLTRLRVLTEVIMVFFALTALTVSLWLFLPKLPYMKAVLVIALVLGAAVAWADVDTVVARYNVQSYQSGRLETIDMDYLYELGTGAVPYISTLTQDKDPVVALRAQELLDHYTYAPPEDFRSWNYARAAAQPYLPEPVTDTVTDY